MSCTYNQKIGTVIFYNCFKCIKKSTNFMFEEKRRKNKNRGIVNANLSGSIWKAISFHDFGFKCIMNKQDLCNDVKCKCFCHMDLGE